MNLKSRLSKLDKLLKLLPTQLDVSSKRVGEKHAAAETEEEAAAAKEVVAKEVVVVAMAVVGRLVCCKI
jgi:hypothetical protein